MITLTIFNIELSKKQYLQVSRSYIKHVLNLFIIWDIVISDIGCYISAALNVSSYFKWQYERFYPYSPA